MPSRNDGTLAVLFFCMSSSVRRFFLRLFQLWRDTEIVKYKIILGMRLLRIRFELVSLNLLLTRCECVSVCVRVAVSVRAYPESG